MNDLSFESSTGFLSRNINRLPHVVVALLFASTSATGAWISVCPSGQICDPVFNGVPITDFKSTLRSSGYAWDNAGTFHGIQAPSVDADGHVVVKLSHANPQGVERRLSAVDRIALTSSARLSMKRSDGYMIDVDAAFQRLTSPTGEVIRDKYFTEYHGASVLGSRGPLLRVGKSIAYLLTPMFVLQVSENEGETWRAIGVNFREYFPANTSYFFAPRNAIVKSPFADEIWMLQNAYGPSGVAPNTGASLGAAIFAFADGATTTRVIDTKSLFAALDADVQGLAFVADARAAGGHAVYAIGGTHIAKSIDRGVTWSRLKTEFKAPATTVASHNGALYVGTYETVMRSDNLGETWSEFAKGLVTDRHYVYSAGGQLLVGNESSWYRCESLDCGGRATTLPFEESQTVVEFYHSRLNQYFVTADVIEAQAIDAGSAGAGWARTGESFRVWTTPYFRADVKPVCRFYGDPVAGPNSHFFTVNINECAELDAKSRTGTKTAKRWNFESTAFFVAEPVGSACPDQSRPVYRLYNDGFRRGIDSNHRLTLNQAARTKMIANGWVDEGIAFCAQS